MCNANAIAKANCKIYLNRVERKKKSAGKQIKGRGKIIDNSRNICHVKNAFSTK